MPIQHTVKQGETTAGLAAEHGLFADTIWNDAANAELKKKRKDMNVLLPGDVLVIPDRRLKEVDKPDAGKHRFKRKGIPAHLKIRVFLRGKPCAGKSFSLFVNGREIKGVTDSDGRLDEMIDPSADSAVLALVDESLELEVQIGDLDPVDTLSGQKGRLNNLGYRAGDPAAPEEAETKAQFRSAVEEFQCDHALKVDGVCGPKTQAKLEEIHGS